MQPQGNSTTPWQKIWKIITNPTVDIVVAIVVVLGAAWIVIDTESVQRKTSFPVLFGFK